MHDMHRVPCKIPMKTSKPIVNKQSGMQPNLDLTINIGDKNSGILHFFPHATPKEHHRLMSKVFEEIQEQSEELHIAAKLKLK